MRKFAGIFGSLSVGALMTGAGLILDAQVFLYGGALLMGLAAVLWMVDWGKATPAEAEPAHHAPAPAAAHVVTSHNQRGGLTAHTVNLGPNRRRLGDARTESLKGQILAQMPRDKKISVQAIMGDTEAYEFAQEIFDFMKANGFDVHGIDQVVTIPPAKGVVVDSTGEPWTMTVGSAP